MRKEAVSTFNKGLTYDLNPIVTPNNVLTDAVNGTFITFNGDELALQNDAGNTTINIYYDKPLYSTDIYKKGEIVYTEVDGIKEYYKSLIDNNNSKPENGINWLKVNHTVQLSDGFYPLGIKEYGGVLYIVSANQTTKEIEFGSYPSPDIQTYSSIDPYTSDITELVTDYYLFAENKSFNPGNKIHFDEIHLINYDKSYFSHWEDEDKKWVKGVFKIGLYQKLDTSIRDITLEVSKKTTSGYWFDGDFNDIIYNNTSFKGTLFARQEIEPIKTFSLNKLTLTKVEDQLKYSGEITLNYSNYNNWKGLNIKEVEVNFFPTNIVSNIDYSKWEDEKVIKFNIETPYNHIGETLSYTITPKFSFPGFSDILEDDYNKSDITDYTNKYIISGNRVIPDIYNLVSFKLEKFLEKLELSDPNKIVYNYEDQIFSGSALCQEVSIVNEKANYIDTFLSESNSIYGFQLSDIIIPSGQTSVIDIVLGNYTVINDLISLNLKSEYSYLSPLVDRFNALDLEYPKYMSIYYLNLFYSSSSSQNYIKYLQDSKSKLLATTTSTNSIEFRASSHGDSIKHNSYKYKIPSGNIVIPNVSDIEGNIIDLRREVTETCDKNIAIIGTIGCSPYVLESNYFNNINPETLWNWWSIDRGILENDDKWLLYNYSNFTIWHLTKDISENHEDIPCKIIIPEIGVKQWSSDDNDFQRYTSDYNYYPYEIKNDGTNNYITGSFMYNSDLSTSLKDVYVLHAKYRMYNFTPNNSGDENQWTYQFFISNFHVVHEIKKPSVQPQWEWRKDWTYNINNASIEFFNGADNIYENTTKNLELAQLSDGTIMKKINILKENNIDRKLATIQIKSAYSLDNSLRIMCLISFYGSGKMEDFITGIVYGDSNNVCLENDMYIEGYIQSNADYTHCVINNLTIGKTYYIKAIIKNNIGISYSEEQSVLIETPKLLNLHTISTTNITSTSATLNGFIGNTDTHSASKEVGFILYLEDGSIFKTVKKDYIDSNTISMNVEDLVPLTTYKVQMYAINSAGKSYGLFEKFTTL